MPAPDSVEERPAQDRPDDAHKPPPATAGPNRKLARDFGSMVGFNGVSIILSFVITSVVLSLLGREAYGEIVSLTSLSLLIVVFGTDWSVQAMIRFGAEEFLRTEKVGQVFWTRLAIAFCGLMVALGVILLATPFLGESLGFTTMGLAFVVVYLPIHMYWLQLQRVLASIHLHKLQYPMLILERLVILAAIGLSCLFDRFRISDILIGYYLGAVIAASTTTWLARHKLGRPVRPDKELARKMMRFSWPMIPSVWMSAMSLNALDYLFIRRYIGTAQLGVYSLAVQIAGMAQQIPLIAGNLTVPRVIGMRLRQDSAAMARFVSDRFVPALWLWTLTCFIVAACVSSLGPMFLPANYVPIAELAWPLAVVTAVVPIWYIVWNPLLMAFEQTKTIMSATLATGLINVTANVILIPRFGMIGSAWASVMAFMMSSICAESITSYRKPADFPRRGPLLYLPACLLACVALAAGYLR